MAILAKFSHPLVFNAPLLGSRWNFVTAVGLKKNWMTPLPECQKVWRYIHSFWTVPALDRQTDRIGKTISRSACIACWRAIEIVRRVWCEGYDDNVDDSSCRTKIGHFSQMCRTTNVTQMCWKLRAMHWCICRYAVKNALTSKKTLVI